MNVMLKNLTRKPLWIKLRSGDAINVSPTSPPWEISKEEADNNPSIQKLVNMLALRLIPVESKSGSKKKHTETFHKSTTKVVAKTEESTAKSIPTEAKSQTTSDEKSKK